MSCGKKGCKRAVQGVLYCRCGATFCSETCFIASWHLDHSKRCEYAEEIREEVKTKEAVAVASGKKSKSGTALLTSVALRRTHPAPRVKQSEAPPVADEQDPALAVVSAGVEKIQQDRDKATERSSTASSPRPRSSEVVVGNESVRYSVDDFETVEDGIGVGAAGTVRKVRRKQTGEIFAMKDIPKADVKKNELEKYLAREIKTQIRLKHPNIIRLHYYFEDREALHLLLEFAPLGSLYGMLRSGGALPEAACATIFVDVGSALDHLHGRGIVHRDLKPENVLMCEGFVAKLADFGWCAEMTEGDERRTFCGTFDYLAPEMVDNQPHDHRLDIWTLGVLLYESLTATPPFAAANQMQGLQRIIKVDLVFPSGFPLLAEDLVRKLLKLEPVDRIPLKDSMMHPWVQVNASNPPKGSKGIMSLTPAVSSVKHIKEVDLDATLDVGATILKEALNNTSPTSPRSPVAITSTTCTSSKTNTNVSIDLDVTSSVTDSQCFKEAVATPSTTSPQSPAALTSGGSAVSSKHADLDATMLMTGSREAPRPQLSTGLLWGDDPDEFSPVAPTRSSMRNLNTLSDADALPTNVAPEALQTQVAPEAMRTQVAPELMPRSAPDPPMATEVGMASRLTPSVEAFLTRGKAEAEEQENWPQAAPVGRLSVQPWLRSLGAGWRSVDEEAPHLLPSYGESMGSSALHDLIKHNDDPFSPIECKVVPKAVGSSLHDLTPDIPVRDPFAEAPPTTCIGPPRSSPPQPAQTVLHDLTPLLRGRSPRKGGGGDVSPVVPRTAHDPFAGPEATAPWRTLGLSLAEQPTMVFQPRQEPSRNTNLHDDNPFSPSITNFRKAEQPTTPRKKQLVDSAVLNNTVLDGCFGDGTQEADPGVAFGGLFGTTAKNHLREYKTQSKREDHKTPPRTNKNRLDLNLARAAFGRK